MKGKIGVIGSGVAGMAAAILLKSKAYEVVVFEANGRPGGKLVDFEKSGFRFDAGPSLFTMPQLLDNIFLSAGKNPRAYYNYQKIDPACNYFWPDGLRFQAHSDPLKFAEAAAETFNVPKDALTSYFKKSAALYDLTEEVFLKSSLHKASTYLRISTLKSALRLGRANIFSTLNRVNEDLLEHPKLVQLFNRYATYNGSDPYRAPGTLMVIPTLEHRWGTFLPDNGMHTITNSLYEVAKDIGVEFRFNQKVEEIILTRKKVSGIRTSSGIYHCDMAVSNMDVVPTYRKLLPEIKIPRKVEQQERSSSAMIFNWGINKTFDNLGLHNIFWSGDYRKEFQKLFEVQDISEDPTIYVNITSKHVRSDAPDGCENWFVMVNAPYIAGQDWDALQTKTRKAILKKLSAHLKCDIEPLIKTEEIRDPKFLRDQTSSHLGSLYGTSSNSRMAAFLRHPNFSAKVKNLYFCGGSVHPGGGIPLCLHSARIVSDLIR